MTAERDDYDVFLDSWEPGPLLEHATLAPNINDPLARQRPLEDSTGAADLTAACSPNPDTIRLHSSTLLWMMTFTCRRLPRSRHEWMPWPH